MRKNKRNIFSKLLNKLPAGLCAVIIVGLMFVVGYGLSWIATCGIIKLVTLCFGWKFSWAVASGIWLIMVLLSSTFKSSSK